MRAASITATGNATRSARQMTCRNTSKVRAIEAIINRAKDLWRSKIAIELADRTGVSVRTAENWLAGDRSIGAGALVALLSGDDGFEFLEAMVESMPPRAQQRWRDEFESAALRASFRARKAALEAEMTAAEKRR